MPQEHQESTSVSELEAVVRNKLPDPRLVIRQDSALGRMMLRSLARNILPDGRVVHPGLVTAQAIEEDQEAIPSRLVANHMD